MLLPTAVEARSFEPASRSGAHLREHYQQPLGLDPEEVRTFDLIPYFFANTAVSEARSMWSNIEAYVTATGAACSVEPRPPPDELVRRAREMPGNEARLAEYFSAPGLRLLLTLGNEAAAWIRGVQRAADAQPLLYGAPEVMQIAGRAITVVHLTHPGSLMRNKAWRAQHASWCRDIGRALVAEHLAG